MEKRKAQIRATWVAVVIAVTLLAAAAAGGCVAWLVEQCTLYCS
jgi:hypothetical protein